MKPPSTTILSLYKNDGDQPLARCCYTARGEVSRDGLLVHVTHNVKNSEFVKAQISQGRAMFVCAVRTHGTGHKQIFLSRNECQNIQLDVDVVGEHPILTVHAMIVVMQDFTHIFSEKDDVAESWIGMCIHFSKGVRLASASVELPLPIAPSVINPQSIDELLKYRVEPNLQAGGFYVEIRSDDGGRIEAHMSADLYDFMSGESTNGELQRSVIAHILTSSLWTLRECIRNDDGSDFVRMHSRIVDFLSELVGESFLNQVESARFQADKIATSLVPLMFGKARKRQQTQFLEFEARKFENLRSALIGETGSEAQVELLQACLSRKSFFSWVKRELGDDKTGQTIPEVFFRKLTEEEFKGMGEVLERKASQLWSDIPLLVACRSSFWGMVTINHIEKGIIEPSYLASVLGKSIKGVKRIERAIMSKDKKEIDDVARTILRKLSGLPEARGAPRSVSCDCPFGRSWWRQRILHETVTLTGGRHQAIADTLYQSKSYWEKLLMLPQMEIPKLKPARFGDNRVRTAFIWALSDYVANYDYRMLFISQGLIDKCMHRFARMSLEREFGVFELEELKCILKEEVIEPEHRGS